MSVILFAMGSATRVRTPLVWISVSMLLAIGAMISVLWAYEGWQYVTFAAGEAVKTPTLSRGRSVRPLR
ncbi:MAG: hypothetical protein U0163_08055 [Gemmatimonadaceae bacterium]